MMPLHPLFSELRRRKVFRVATVYAIAAWALLEMADVLAPALHLPAWTITFVAFVAFLGFPVALIVAWAFEVTPEGVRRTQTVEGKGEWKGKPGYVVPGALLALIGVGAYAYVGPSPRQGMNPDPSPDSSPHGSIAVLPFVNMSADPEQDYFSDGLTEELLNALAQIPDLRVAARTSSFAFKNVGAPVDSIGRVLRVAHVLEGSVRKAGDRVRITAQLIRSESGYHLWSETYDRDLSDIFAVQEEIARAIVGALEFELGSGDRVPVAATPSLEAYDTYLRSLALDYTNREENETAVGLLG